MNRIAREFQVFVKPVGASCNLGCRYCYYLEKKQLYPRLHRMDHGLLERYIIQHIEASTDETVMFSWHGGEPTLAGIDFFRMAVELQYKYIPEGKRVINGIQTNGILLDDEWCKFLSEHNFIVGISIDGPPELHNKYRRTIDGKGTHDRTLRGYELLLKHGIVNEVLCVLNSLNIRYPIVLYDYFKGLGAKYLTFLPLVIPSGSSGQVTTDTVPAKDYGIFLSTVFDRWIENDIGKIKIQIFEEAARTAFNMEHTLCIFKVDCGGVPVIEHNGDFYSCDHYVDREHLVGNIHKGSVAGFLDSDIQKAFGKTKSRTLPKYCLECQHRDMCNGECPKNRFLTTPDGEPGLNYLCEGYKLFFTHCRPFVEALKAAWYDQQGIAPGS